MEMVDLQCTLTPIPTILHLLKIWVSMSNNPRTMPASVGFLSAQYIGESRIGAPYQAANIMISRSHLQSAPQTSLVHNFSGTPFLYHPNQNPNVDLSHSVFLLK